MGTEWRVYRHAMPRELWRDEFEGLWVHRATILRGSHVVPVAADIGDEAEAYATPTGELVTRADGAVAEVWEIRLTDRGEQRLRGALNE